MRPATGHLTRLRACRRRFAGIEPGVPAYHVELSPSLSEYRERIKAEVARSQ